MFCRRPIGVASSLCKMGQPRATPRSLAEGQAGEAVRWGGGPTGGRARGWAGPRVGLCPVRARRVSLRALILLGFSFLSGKLGGGAGPGLLGSVGR